MRYWRYVLLGTLVGLAMTEGPWATQVGVVLIYVGMATAAAFLVRFTWFALLRRQ